MIETVPSFSRVEITHRDKKDLIIAAAELRVLAGEIDLITGQHTDEDAVILAHHKIRATSQKLRGRND